MAELPDASIDAIVSDPPYELGFMGKRWDASGIAYDLEVWRQAFRVLKPGGHLLAFSGSRTYHRMTCAIEDAGFDIRDQIMWVYGSGFPKSLDVSKAIAKAGGTSPAETACWLREQRDAAGLTRTEVAERVGCTEASVRDWEEGRARAEGKPVEFIVPSEDYRARLEALFGYPKDTREVTGTSTNRRGDGTVYGVGLSGILRGSGPTEHAAAWKGWGTALKPAHEPICMARKPLAGTVAANVLRYGTGAINVDGCRVTSGDGYTDNAVTQGINTARTSYAPAVARRTFEPSQIGRWPTNVLHDGSDEATEGLREAARYFYTAKADRSDREEVIGDIPRRIPPAVECQGDFDKKGLNSPRAGAGRTARDLVNVHPTVKPTELMRYLVRMVTPPGGLVLDPFTGSGSTGRAAMLEGMGFVGCELSPEYAEIARARIRYTLGPMFAHLVE